MRWILLAIVVVIIAVAGWIGWVEYRATAIANIPYTLQMADGDFEVRRYPSVVLASVDAKGSRQEALSEGMAPLRDYISGDNQSGDAIDMTRPVLQMPIDADAASTNLPAGEDDWTVSFVMPAWFTAGTLPRPKSDAIAIEPAGAVTVAVITFSGFTGDQNLAEQTASLRKWMEEKDLKAAGPPRYAIYDPPWRLPFLRRNEVMIPLAPPQ